MCKAMDAEQASSSAEFDDLENGQVKSSVSTEDESPSRPSQPVLMPAFLSNLRTSPATKNPKATLQAIYGAGEYKAGLPLDILIVQSFMAGIYIAMAGHLFLTAKGGILGASLFPTGLFGVILTSAELFTGDSLVFVASVLGGRVSFKYLIRNWTVSWIFNFLGCLFWAYFMAFLSDAIFDAGADEFAIQVAYKKVHQTWGQILLKAMGANFMVCLGVWQATCAEEVSGKILAVWFPVAGFVLAGFDHVIANQFLIPLGMMLGADIDMYTLFVEALLPATIGNIIGGGVLVGAIYWYVFDSMNTKKSVMGRVNNKAPGNTNQNTPQLISVPSNSKSPSPLLANESA